MAKPTPISTPRAGSSRAKLLLIASLFFLPVVAALVLFQTGWRPQGQVNHGELVRPIRLIADRTLHTLEGQPFSVRLWHKKWTMLYFGPADCGSVCQQQLYKMRQVHIAQGAGSERIQRVFVVTDTGKLDQLRYTLKDYADMQVLTGPADTIRQLAAQFQLPAGSPMQTLERIYLLDPLGHFMLSYPEHADPDGMRKDLVRLLKVSHIG